MPVDDADDVVGIHVPPRPRERGLGEVEVVSDGRQRAEGLSGVDMEQLQEMAAALGHALESFLRNPTAPLPERPRAIWVGALQRTKITIVSALPATTPDSPTAYRLSSSDPT